MAVEVTQRTDAPYSAVCYIEVTFPNGARSRGSGVVVGPNDVLTALHVVFSQADGGWATSFLIQPGADTQPTSTPLGTFIDVGTTSGRVPNWDADGDGLLFAEESQFDLALLGLRSRIGDTTGWLPVAPERAFFTAELLGYPARGTGLMREMYPARPESSTGTLAVAVGLGAGASGGPALQYIDAEPHVAGLLSSGDEALTTSRYAALFGPGNLAWLQDNALANDHLIAGQISLRLQGDHTANTLTGNSANNIILAGAGRDRISGAGGNDVVDGGPGVDTLALRGPRAEYQLTPAGAFSGNAAGLPSSFEISHRLIDSTSNRDGTLDLSAVERLVFTDSGVALDVRSEAGDAVALVGTTLGTAAMRNPVAAGVALAWLDRGNSLESLAQLALVEALGPNAPPQAVLGLLFRHFTGQSADAATLALLEPLLTSGRYTPATLAIAVSQVPEHPARLALMGVSNIEYSVF